MTQEKDPWEDVGITIEIDGREYKGWTFRDCTFVYRGGAVPVFEDCKFVGKSVLEIKDAAACTLLTLNLFELALPGVMRQFLKQSDPEELLGRPN
jgi:hypothetical protein